MSYFNITIAMCTNNISLLKFESCEALKRYTEIAKKTLFEITCNPANQIRLPFFGGDARVVLVIRLYHVTGPAHDICTLFNCQDVVTRFRSV